MFFATFVWSVYYLVLILRPGRAVTMRADSPARVMLYGGEPMEGPRYIWWNFVSSSKDRIEQAKEDWKAADWANGPFRLPPGDEKEFIPISPELDRTRPRGWD